MQEFIDSTQAPINPVKSAEESMKAFIENGLADVAKSAEKGAEKAAKTSHNKVLIGLAAIGAGLAALFGYNAANNSEVVQKVA